MIMQLLDTKTPSRPSRSSHSLHWSFTPHERDVQKLVCVMEEEDVGLVLRFPLFGGKLSHLLSLFRLFTCFVFSLHDLQL
jgi:hypothetical protein